MAEVTISEADFLKAVAVTQGIIDKLKSIAPKHWKGNEPPNTHHFDAESIKVDAGVLIDEKAYWVDVKYSDSGTAHELHAKVHPLGGTPDEITYDGQPFDNDDFEFSHREGLEGLTFYARVLLLFKGTDASGNARFFRFDGG